MRRLKNQLLLASLMLALVGMAHAEESAGLDRAIAALHRGDTAAAINVLLPLAKHENADAQFMLVSVLQTVDQKQAGYWLRKAADNRQPDACHILGIMYLHGVGVTEDPHMAKKWLLIAAEHGVKAAQLHLGILYREGPNSIQDDGEAFKWLSKAADAGDAEAQYRLAIMYRYGYGVAADSVHMQKLLKQAANQGHVKAAQALAEITR